METVIRVSTTTQIVTSATEIGTAEPTLQAR